MKTIWTTVLAIGLASALIAQNQPAQNEDVLRVRKKLEAAADEAKKIAFSWQTAEFVSGQLISGPPVKGAPYSAEAVNESVQTLADGNRIVQRTTAMQYRDNDGRERREETSNMGAIFISDPVAGTRYTLHPESHSAEKGGLPVVHTTSVGAGRGETFTVAVAGPGPGIPGGAPQDFLYVNTGQIARFSKPADFKTEDLGKMYVEGVEAQGTRTTTTIPAGDIGNDRPINIVDERWYSPDLQMTVSTKHSDPRTGETSFRLSKINRSSPPPYLFEVPSDYTVNAGGGGRGARGGAIGPDVRILEQRK